MDILGKIDREIKRIDEKMLSQGTKEEQNARKEADMVDINAWAKKHNVDINKRIPKIGGDAYSAHLTNKEKKKLGIETLQQELEYWKPIQDNIMYHKKKAGAGQVGTLWRKKQGYKDIDHIQRYVSHRVEKLKDMIKSGRK